MGRVADNPLAALLWKAATGQLEDGLPLRLGTGETVPGTFIQAQARGVFAMELYRLAPQSTEHLLSEEARAIYTSFVEAWRDQYDTTARGKPLRYKPYPVVVDTLDKLEAHIHDWQHRYQLSDEWIAKAAMRTFKNAREMPSFNGKKYSGPLFVFDKSVTAHDGKNTAWDGHPVFPEIFRRGFTPVHHLREIPVSLDMLKRPDIKYAHGVSEDDGNFGTFDPRTETVAAAAKRLMPVLENRLRRALEGIAKDDRILNGAQLPVTFRKTTGFEWLVRYQVLGESRNHIAAADGVDRAQVSRQVQRTADLVGLTLRESPGGSPLKKRSNTQRVR